ncbi:MAG: M42 family metallopeptidase [Candidatus Izemoplasmatales bacterium]|jgi:putative aminopeptidase FrvX|nr:M42 family metallopeptidase [Candidatus Izemoplasmatales bacterium]
MKKYYQDLVNLPGVSGQEKYVRNYMREHLEKLSEEIVEDNLGSIFGGVNLASDGPTVMIAGHMDEIGAIVKEINKNGSIKLLAIGGVNPAVVISQHMNVVIDDGSFVPGVIGAKPPHLLRDGKTAQVSSFDDFFLDIGADSYEHAKELGIRIGQQVVFENNYKESKDGKKIFSKAWDDRFGSAMALDILESVDKKDLKCKLYAGANVQEEVGLRGATTSSFKLQPDLFIAVDCSPCTDTFEKSEVGGTLGAGFMVRFYDPRALIHQGMKKFIEETAEKNNIQYQYYNSLGGTDAAAVQLSREGVLVCTIGMPSRYIHSTTSIIHKDDYLAVKNQILAMLKEIDWDKIKEIKRNV